jgi:DNA polymerase elongation subunit (family B)
MTLIRELDPDIVLGWELQRASIGYLVERTQWALGGAIQWLGAVSRINVTTGSAGGFQGTGFGAAAGMRASRAPPAAAPPPSAAARKVQHQHGDDSGHAGATGGGGLVNHDDDGIALDGVNDGDRADGNSVDGPCAVTGEKTDNNNNNNNNNNTDDVSGGHVDRAPAARHPQDAGGRASRRPHAPIRDGEDVAAQYAVARDYEARKQSGIRIPGRHVLNLWRIMRKDVKLPVYTLQTVHKSLTGRRLPHYPPEVLTRWYMREGATGRARALRHLHALVAGTVAVLDARDVIGRTSELARVFGIDFFSVLWRGSQYRVESILVRLTRSLGLSLISPSRTQVRDMAPLESVPMILEPESKFHADPVAVLDFQSLYPSIMIAYNMCFSTCLGRVPTPGRDGHVSRMTELGILNASGPGKSRGSSSLPARRAAPPPARTNGGGGGRGGENNDGDSGGDDDDGGGGDHSRGGGQRGRAGQKGETGGRPPHVENDYSAPPRPVYLSGGTHYRLPSSLWANVRYITSALAALRRSSPLGALPPFPALNPLLDRLVPQLAAAEGRRAENRLWVSPAEVMFVKTTVRRGVVPRMLAEILEARVAIKREMARLELGELSSSSRSPEARVLLRALDARQLALKMIANVTYGYVSATMSGRMPCVEIADSIVETGRRTLAAAMDTAEQLSTSASAGAASLLGPAAQPRVVYGDTDSLFVRLPGATVESAFDFSAAIERAVTAANPRPIRLKFEKVYSPCILPAKKRYAGWAHFHRGAPPRLDTKGLETIRRDAPAIVASLLREALTRICSFLIGGWWILVFLPFFYLNFLGVV